MQLKPTLPRLLAHAEWAALGWGRIVTIAVSNFISNNDLLWASALTYTVTLSIVPILALAFSMLKGLGGLQMVRPLVNRYLALGSPQITGYVMGFITNVNAAALGSVGGLSLALTVISTLGTIESAFNSIWQVPTGRSYLRKFSDYLSVVFTVPLLLLAALTLTASFGTRFYGLPGLAIVLPFGMIWVGFLFLFVFFPYTRVRWGPAILGSFISALLFQFAQWAYVHFQVGVASYRAIYGALATLPILLIWLYVAWIIVLLGVEICFAAQRGTTRSDTLARSLDFMLYAALLALLRLAERATNPNLIVDADSLAAELQVGGQELEPVLTRLRERGLVIEAADSHPGAARGLFLSAAPQVIRVGDALAALEDQRSELARGDPRLTRLLATLIRSQTEQFNTLTLSDLMRDDPRAQVRSGAEVQAESV